MWVRSDVTSGRNRRWEWRPDAGDAEDGKTTSDVSGRGARASDAGLIFADVVWTPGGVALDLPRYVVALATRHFCHYLGGRPQYHAA